MLRLIAPALSLLLASNLTWAHAGHDHSGHAPQPPAARQEKASAIGTIMAGASAQPRLPVMPCTL